MDKFYLFGGGIPQCSEHSSVLECSAPVSLPPRFVNLLPHLHISRESRTARGSTHRVLFNAFWFLLRNSGRGAAMLVLVA